MGLNLSVGWKSLVVAAIISLAIPTHTQASHAVGADLTYICTGPNQYEVSLSFYRDCDGVSAPVSALVNIGSISCGFDTTITLTGSPNNPQIVPSICQQQATNTTCQNGNLPGIEEYIYSGNITLGCEATDWTVSYSICCRNAAITNLQDPDNESLYVEATLDNTNGKCNNSAQFTIEPVPFICVGDTFFYNHGVVDFDGDSLVFSLINPLTASNTPINYVGGYSPTNPMTTGAPFSFNTATGQMIVNATSTQQAVVTVLVEEYRNGVLIGTAMRDIQIVSINSPNCSNPPDLTGIDGTIIFDVSVCAGQPVCFDVFTSDFDPNDNVTLEYFGILPGATFTSDNAQFPTGSFCWTPTSNDVGSNVFSIRARDDHCPIIGSNTQAYTIVVTPPSFDLTVDSSNIPCFGDPSGGSIDITIGPNALPPITIDWAHGPTGVTSLTNLTAGLYTVSVTDSVNCVLQRDINIIEPDLITSTIDTVEASCFSGGDGEATVHAIGGTPPFTFLWSDGQTDSTAVGLASGNYQVTITDASNCTATAATTVTEPSPIILSTDFTPALCFGGNDGSAVVTPSGGVGDFTYAWSTNPAQTDSLATGLTAGAYTVSVADSNNCEETAVVNVQEPDSVVLSFTTIDISCYGFDDGEATVIASGGTGPGTYTFTWNTNPASNTATITNLPPGTYSATVEDGNNCISIGQVTIFEPDTLTISLDSTDVLCHGENTGTATVTAQGGIIPYSYLWSSSPSQNTTTATGLPLGTYQVTVTDDNGCTAIGAIGVDEPPLLEIIDITPTDPICYDGTDGFAEATATGGLGNLSYQWSTIPTQNTSTAADLSSGTYELTVTDENNCTVSEEVVITDPEPVVVDIVPDTTIISFGQNAQLSTQIIRAAYGANSFSWDNTGDLNCLSCPDPTASPLATTTYTVEFIDALGCTATASAVVVVDPIDKSLYAPNAFSPEGDGTNDFFHIYGLGIEYIELKIFNRWGELLFESYNLADGWDGTYRGERMLPGVYVYRVEAFYLDGDTRRLHGSFLLIR